jgi:hypothetical protein
MFNLGSYSPPDVKKNMNLYLLCFLSLITLGLYAVYYYGNTFARNLNNLSKRTLGGNAPKISLSASRVYIGLLLLFSPLLLLFFGFLVPVLMGFNALPYVTNIARVLAVAAIIAGVLTIRYLAVQLRLMRHMVIQIAEHYGRFDLIESIAKAKSSYGTGDEGYVYVAFNELVDEYNKNRKIRDGLYY